MVSSSFKAAAYKGVHDAEGLRLLQGSASLTVTVGTIEHGRTWILAEKLLTHHSPFFAAALNGLSAEASSKTVTLPEDEPAVFELFVQWLYLGEICRGSEDDYLHVQAWIFGDKVGVKAFQDQAMLRLIHYHVFNGITPDTLRAAFAGSKPGSKLRTWALEQFVFDSRYGTLDDGAETWVSYARVTEDFALAFLQAAVNRSNLPVLNPYDIGFRYLEVLPYKKEEVERWFESMT